MPSKSIEPAVTPIPPDRIPRMARQVNDLPLPDLPAVTAKESATITDIAGTTDAGAARFALNVVAAWWEEEARQYGGAFTRHDDR